MTRPSALHLSYSLTLTDLFWGQLLYLRSWRFLGRHAANVGCWAAAGLLLMHLVQGSAPDLRTLIIYIIIVLAASLSWAFLFGLCFLPVYSAWANWKFYGKNPKFFTDLKMDLDDCGFHFATSFSSVNMPWGEVVGFKEDAKVLVLFITKEIFYLLPKRAFSAAHLAELEALVTQNSKRLP